MAFPGDENFCNVDIQTMMLSPTAEFIFDTFSADYHIGEAVFHYTVKNSGSELYFTETLIFDPVDPDSFSKEQHVGLRNILSMLSLMLGISYWKLFCPSVIRTPYISLSEKQAGFWNTFYTKGLGEFYYRNSIDFRNIVHFPYDGIASLLSGAFSASDSSLLLFGGGKDSIVSGELLKKHGQKFTLFSVGRYAIQDQTAEIMDKKIISVERNLDPQMLDLTYHAHVFRGHIPMTAIYSLLGLFIAALNGHGYVIASSEESSSYGNTQYLGTEINHQWSKSLEYEQLFQQYIREYIGTGITYFSLLRPFKEIEIVRKFAQYTRYFPVFSSCNRNFRIHHEPNEPLWCGECAKCAFVSLLLAAFLNKTTVHTIIGRQMLYDHSLLPLYRMILGIEGFKPFDCVGEPGEARWALMQLVKNGEYADSQVIRQLLADMHTKKIGIPDDEVLFSKSRHHLIPSEFSNLISLL